MWGAADYLKMLTFVCATLSAYSSLADSISSLGGDYERFIIRSGPRSSAVDLRAIQQECTDRRPRNVVDECVKATNRAAEDHMLAPRMARQRLDEQKRENERLRQVEARRDEWGPKVTQLVIERDIQIGMSRDQVRLAWGEPHDINRDVGPWGTREQWIYGESYYLYFDNGVLRSWQQR